MPDFTGFSGKTGFRIRWTGYRIQKFICVKTYLVQSKYYPKFQPNWSNNTLKSGFFRIYGKTGSRIWNFFGLKPPCDQDEANKKKFIQIGPAVLELWGKLHTYIHTDRQRSYYFRVRIWELIFMIKNKLPAPLGITFPWDWFIQ